MSIQAILTQKRTKVITALATETLKRAADRMREHGIAALVVKNGDTVMGVISEREIVYAVSRNGERSLSISVRDLMSPTLITVAPSDPLVQAMR